MKIAIGSDHHGLEHRQTIAKVVEAQGGTPMDLGTHTAESCDYPDIAFEVATSVQSGNADLGVLVCGTGIGMAIAANKVAGIRAAVCHDVNTSILSRQHNNANVLCVPGKALSGDELQAVVEAWLTSEFEGGRHARRVDKITGYENEAAGVSIRK